MMLFESRERQAYQHIRAEIEGRLVSTGAPVEISDFLLNHWAYLLVGIYIGLGDQHPDWEAGWQTVNALLWSLAPKRDRAETEQFLRLLPTLLGRLQDGCDAMKLAPAERDALFSQLALLHAAVARAGLQAQPGEAGPVTHFGQDADMVMGDEELAGLSQRTPAITKTKDSFGPSDELGLDRLKVGGGMLLKTAAGEKRLYLQWVSPMGGMYLFANADGFDAVSLTRARLIERLAKGDAHLV